MSLSIMTVVAIVIVTGAAIGWIFVRRCPLAHAIGCQIDQIASSSAR